MTRIEELQAMVAELEGEALFIDQDGDACLAPPGRELNLVALPGRDDDGSLLRPDAWAAMVNRFNEFPTLATEHAAALAREAELREAVTAYHLALDRREHGGVAGDKLVNAVQSILKMPWKQGAALGAQP